MLRKKLGKQSFDFTSKGGGGGIYTFTIALYSKHCKQTAGNMLLHFSATVAKKI